MQLGAQDLQMRLGAQDLQMRLGAHVLRNGLFVSARAQLAAVGRFFDGLEE